MYYLVNIGLRIEGIFLRKNKSYETNYKAFNFKHYFLLIIFLIKLLLRKYLDEQKLISPIL